MGDTTQPLVSVLTPVYNGEKYLAECIESVLNQSYQNFEYIIINNCSKDGTLAIAQEYAKKDSRIKVHDNTDFVAVIANHNIAFGLVSPEAKYVKIVSGDDWIFPTCIERLVEFGEANPSVGFINCYQLSGDHILWQGLRHPNGLVPGVEMCRRVLLGHDNKFGFGSPTSLMYRADLVRASKEFYPNPSPHSDTSALVRDLHKCDFGFVFEVLSYERTHEETRPSGSPGTLRATPAAGVGRGPRSRARAAVAARTRRVVDADVRDGDRSGGDVPLRVAQRRRRVELLVERRGPQIDAPDWAGITGRMHGDFIPEDAPGTVNDMTLTPVDRRDAAQHRHHLPRRHDVLHRARHRHGRRDGDQLPQAGGGGHPRLRGAEGRGPARRRPRAGGGLELGLVPLAVGVESHVMPPPVPKCDAAPSAIQNVRMATLSVAVPAVGVDPADARRSRGRAATGSSSRDVRRARRASARR